MEMSAPASPAPGGPSPPHLVQLEIRRTFHRRPTPRRRGPGQPASAVGQPGSPATPPPREPNHAGEAHGEADRLATVPPPTNIYLGETYTAEVLLHVPAEASPHAAHKVHLVVEIHSGIPPLPTAAAAAAAPAGPPPPSQIRQYSLSMHDFDRIDPLSPSGPGSAATRGRMIQVPLEWELKELGSHAVVCLVSYGVQVTNRETGEQSLVMRSYRRILRFDVLNPLSVRTKAHAPSPFSSPSTFHSPRARRHIFLEVQVQNHCDSRMTFERIRFEPVRGFKVSDEANRGFVVVEGDYTTEREEQGRPGSDEVAKQAQLDFLPLETGHVRQFLYVLMQTSSSSTGPESGVTAVAGGGSALQQALGRLDIVWQTERGQKGRLQSATLGRRVPLAPTLPGSGPTLSAEPGLSLTGPPPSGLGPRGSDRSSPAPPPPSRPPTSLGDSDAARSDSRADVVRDTLYAPDVEGLLFDVTVEEVLPVHSTNHNDGSTTTTVISPGDPRAPLRPTFLVNEPVSVRLRIRVARKGPPNSNSAATSDASTAVPPTSGEKPGRRRVHIVLQHLQWPVPHQLGDGSDDSAASFDPYGDNGGRRGSASVDLPGAMPGSPRARRLELPGITSLEQQQQQQASLLAARNGVAVAPPSPATAGDAAHRPAGEVEVGRLCPTLHGVRLPPPVPSVHPPPPPAVVVVPSTQVRRVGSDTVDVGFLDVQDAGTIDHDHDDDDDACATVEIRFVPLERGLVRFGGVRLVVLPRHIQEGKEAVSEGSVAKTVWETNAIAEVWSE
ncbi:hypothetical protein JCM3774_001567 [Rhodotorula dairenensis]